MVLLCAISTFLFVLSPAVAQSPEGSQALLLGQRFAISAEELPAVRDRAERGDVIAIRRMVEHYMIYEADEAPGIHWLERLGDTGDVEARKDVVEYYVRHPSSSNTKHLVELRSRWHM
nr:hypothetical protein [Dyella sp. ASV24]